MKKPTITFSRLNYVTCALFLIFLALGVNAWSSANKSSAEQENTEHKVIKHLSYPNQPVDISKIKVKGKAIKLNEKIGENGDDWLNDLSIEATNISDKTITYIEMNLDFPETKTSGNMMTFPLKYGQNPRAAIVTGQPESLPPNQTTTFNLSGQILTSLKDFIGRRHSLSNLKKVTIHLNQVSFEDGTIWTGGSFFRVDPNNPKRYIRLEN
jgi:hypothetical protein